jgi:hypothetical protein
MQRDDEHGLAVKLRWCGALAREKTKWRHD